MSACKISIIIVNYNAGDFLGRCIESLREQIFADFEVIVVDNGSTDGSLEHARTEDARFRFAAQGTNLGFAAANNVGVDLAKGEWIATLNPDAFPAADWLQAFVAATARYPDIVMFGSCQLQANTPTILDGIGDCYHILGLPWRGGYGHPVPEDLKDGEVFAPCAAAAFYRRDVFVALGGFDPSFFCYCEDIDLAFRFRLAGHRCIQLSGARVRHVGSAITGRTSDFTLYHTWRNRIWVIAKNMPFPAVVVFLPLHLLVLVYLLFRLRKTQGVDAMRRGAIAGVRGLGAVLRVRREVQRARTVSFVKLLRSLSWSIHRLKHHEPYFLGTERGCCEK